jgi:hypothetical protein
MIIKNENKNLLRTQKITLLKKNNIFFMWNPSGFGVTQSEDEW